MDSLCEVRNKLVNNMNVLEYTALSELLEDIYCLLLIGLNTISV